MDQRTLKIFQFGFLLFFSVVAIIFMITSESRTEKYLDGFESVSMNSAIDSRVLEVRNEHGSAIISIETGQDILLKISLNKMYKPSVISGFIKVGDSITKKSNSDSLLVKRGDKTFFFILGRVVEKNGSVRNF